MRQNTNSRRPVNPRDIPKASQFRRKQEPSNTVTGTREPTEHGYRISGTVCKDYETYFEYLGEGQTTDKTVHAKKTRTYRILGGQGFAILEKDGVQKSVVLVPGHELVVEAGIAQQLITTSTNELEFFVTQSAKYESTLKVLEKSTTTARTDESKLQSISHDQAVRSSISTQVRVRKSKAVEQQRLLGIGNKAAPAATPSMLSAMASGDPTFSVNLRPSGGSDLRGAEG